MKSKVLVALAATLALSACTTTDPYTGQSRLSNTAGGGLAKRTLAKDGPHPLEDFQRVIDLNLIASFNVSRLVSEYMSKNEPNEEGPKKQDFSYA